MSKIYMANLPADTRESDVKKFLEDFGSIKDIVIKYERSFVYAFVEFEDHGDARDAVKDLDGTKLEGNRVRVEFSKDSGEGPSEGSSRKGESMIYMGNLPNDCTDEDIEEFLKGYGKVRKNIIKNDGHYGFVEFEDHHDARDAVKDLNGTKMNGKEVRLEFSRGARDNNRKRQGASPPRRKGHRCVVENLSSRTSWQDLKDFMRQAGDVIFSNTNHDRSGEGVVEFGSRRDMEYAIEKLDGEELGGRNIRVKKEEGRGRSRSGSRRRSRAKSEDRSAARGRGSRRSRSRSIPKAALRKIYNIDRSSSSSRSRSRSRSRRRSRSRL